MKTFPGGIKKFEAAPLKHPSSIMPLHSTSAGGRGPQHSTTGKEIVGGVILKGKREFWGVANQHYHQGMAAGENTLNAHCARLVTRTLNANNGRYDADLFLENYMAFMTSETPLHPDTYAESYHRGFFANFAKGLPPRKCGARTHDTASIGGLVMIAPIAISELLFEPSLKRVQALCREHLYLTHPDEKLGKICDIYVELINALLFRAQDDPRHCIQNATQKSTGVNFKKLMEKNVADEEVIGGVFSKACYIDDSWPSILFLLQKYVADPEHALLANTNLGGENCHRGSVLGILVGLVSSNGLDSHFANLLTLGQLESEIEMLLMPNK